MISITKTYSKIIQWFAFKTILLPLIKLYQKLKILKSKIQLKEKFKFLDLSSLGEQIEQAEDQIENKEKTN